MYPKLWLSLLLILFDLLIQTYNYFCNEQEFDSTITILAGLGIVGTIATATGVGVVANVGVASTKTIVKALRKLGPEAADFLKTLSHYLDSKVIEAPRYARSAAERS